jgi:hypothetical protein
VSDTEVELDEEAKRLKLEAIKAGARKEIAQAQRDTLTALLPSSDLKPLEGKVDVGAGVGLIAKLLGYELLHDAAATIATAIAPKLKNSARVLVVEDRSLAGRDWSYEILRAELDAHIEAMEAAKRVLEGKAALGAEIAVDAISGVIGAIAGIVGMFRSDYSITAKDFTIGTTPLVAAVTEKLLAAAELTVEHFSRLEGKIITDFEAARKTRRDLERLSQQKSTRVQETDRRIADLRPMLKAAFASYATVLAGKEDPKPLMELIKSLEKDIDDAEKAVAADRGVVILADTVGARFDAFAIAVLASPKDGSYPPLVGAAMQERLRTGPGKYTHVLYVAVEGAGGETITRKSHLFKSGVMVFMGGAQVSYLLLDLAANTTTAAGTESLLGHLRYELKSGRTGTMTREKLRGPKNS